MIIHVYGTPAPQGSKRHVGHGVMIESSKAVKPWREAVKFAALDWLGNPPGSAIGDPIPYPLAGPLHVSAIFKFPRPKSHYRTGRNAHLLRDRAPTYPITPPDVDKLVRSTLDALADAGVFRNDAQVVDLLATKVYAETAGATLMIEVAT